MYCVFLWIMLSVTSAERDCVTVCLTFVMQGCTSLARQVHQPECSWLLLMQHFFPKESLKRLSPLLESLPSPSSASWMTLAYFLERCN